MIRLPPIRMTLEMRNPQGLEFDPASLFRAMERTMLELGETVRGVWIRRAIEKNVRHTGAYIRGIASEGRVEVTKHPPMPKRALASGTWTMQITVTNTAPHASIVEDGHAAFSLPQAIDWGRKAGRVKMSKDGTPYLHIPFRQFTPASGVGGDVGATAHRVKNAMPPAVYRQAKRLQYTQRMNSGEQRAANGQFIAADRYKWGGRLQRPPMAPGVRATGDGLVVERRSERRVGRTREGTLVNPAWKTSRFAGMFKSGSARHSEYMTIRTITPHSAGWNIPAQHGLGIAREVAFVAARMGGERFRISVEEEI